MSSYHDKCVPPEWTQTQPNYLIPSLELYIKAVKLVLAQFDFFLSESIYIYIFLMYMHIVIIV